MDEQEKEMQKQVGRSLKKSVASANNPNLPYCQEGIEFTEQVGPCRKKEKHRRSSFRVPLRKEDGNLESQIIEYNCEFPNRVVVRLEYLMQTTKVRLNDRLYMDEFYEKLLEEEKRALKKTTRAREKAEQSRMKQLIIDGINKEIPEELSYLHKHPIFRVNQMLARLEAFDHQMFASNLDDTAELTPVEPYEYDGNRFFTHLHDTGTLWIPEEQMHHDRAKLRAKIYRAKLRLLYKREQQAMEDKLLRLINSKSSLSQLHPHNRQRHHNNEDEEEEDDDNVSVISEDEVDEEDNDKASADAKFDAENRRLSLYTKIQRKAKLKMGAIEEKIRQSKINEMEREAELDIKRRELEHVFVETVNYDTLNIISDYEKRQRRRTIEELLERERSEIVKSKTEVRELMKQGSTQKLEGRGLFNQLRKAFNIPGSYLPEEKYENEFVSELIDKAEDCDDLMQNGDEVTLLYDRQRLVLEDHVNDKREKESCLYFPDSTLLT